MKFIAKTFFGLEEILAKEIQELGGSNIQILNRAVSFEGNLETLYKVNYWSRVALRIIKPFLSFKAHNETVLYKRLRRYDWTNLIKLDQTFKVNCVVHSSIFTHSRYIALKTKDAIVDLFRLKLDDQRPSIDVNDPDLIIDVHCYENEFTISLDSSGDSLHRRGYRQSNRPAPLNEILAAGMILLSGWDKKSILFDPMCGSGTLLIEALMIARKMPPRKSRKKYAFMNWHGFDKSIWRQITSEEKTPKQDRTPELIGYDKNKRLLSETDHLLKKMGYDEFIKLENVDFLSHSHPPEPGMIIMNPPYGKRLKESEIIEFYKSIGDTLKKKYDGWSAWILSGNKEAIKSIGLKTSKKRTLYNGPIECKYHLYEMYKGTKKRFKNDT